MYRFGSELHEPIGRRGNGVGACPSRGTGRVSQAIVYECSAVVTVSV
jgi:hypothetical protein